VSPEDAAELGDLKSYTRDLMHQMERDLQTRLEWVAVDHFDTEHPHTHIVLRGVADDGKDLIIARDYISHGDARAGVRAHDALVGAAHTARHRGKPCSRGDPGTLDRP